MKYFSRQFVVFNYRIPSQNYPMKLTINQRSATFCLHWWHIFMIWTISIIFSMWGFNNCKSSRQRIFLYHHKTALYGIVSHSSSIVEWAFSLALHLDLVRDWWTKVDNINSCGWKIHEKLVVFFIPILIYRHNISKIKLNAINFLSFINYLIFNFYNLKIQKDS